MNTASASQRSSPKATPAILVASALALSGAAFTPATHAAPETGKMTTEAPSPGLKVGDKAPDATVTSEKGEPKQLADIMKGKKTIVVFYRGGWCPFCTKSLKGWQGHMDDVTKAGAQIVFISPEKPENAAKTESTTGIGATVFSDTSMAAAKAFKLDFVLDDKTQEKYKGYGINLPDQNASGTWALPHPATYIVDEKGEIRFAESNVDYTKRTDPQKVIDALKAVK